MTPLSADIVVDLGVNIVGIYSVRGVSEILYSDDCRFVERSVHDHRKTPGDFGCSGAISRVGSGDSAEPGA